MPEEETKGRRPLRGAARSSFRKTARVPARISGHASSTPLSGPVSPRSRKLNSERGLRAPCMYSERAQHTAKATVQIDKPSVLLPLIRSGRAIRGVAGSAMRAVVKVTLLGSLWFAIASGCGGDDENKDPTGTGGGTSDASIGGSSSGGSGITGGSGGTGGIDGSASGGTAGVPEQTGSSCEQPTDCYSAINAEDLSGAVACLSNVENGYCTHECTEDTECCAVEGECQTDLAQVCASFTSASAKYCFLSCEDEDIANAAGGAGGGGGAGGAAGGLTPDEYCKRYAHPSFVCRSTGGGIENRKACMPGGIGAGGAGGLPGTAGAGGEPGTAGAGGAPGGAGGLPGTAGAGGATAGAGGSGGAP